MKVGFFLTGLSSGGIYNQTKGAIKLINKLELNDYDKACIITDEEDLSLGLENNDIELIVFKKSFFKKLIFNFIDIINENRIFKKNLFLNPFQKFLKKNKIDFIIFIQPSFYSLYCDGLQFAVNIWNTEIKKHYNLNEFISGGYEYQNKIINFSVEKAFKIIVFTERNKKDLQNFYNCDPEKIVIQNLTPILPNIYEANKNKDYLKIFNNLNLNSNFKWFFYPAQFWPHKNHKYLIDVMKELNKQNYNKIGFIFCGPDKGNLIYIKEIIKKENLDNHFKILGFISDEQIISIYKNCAGVIMPTLLGRSSLPLLEGFFFKKKIFYSKNVVDDNFKHYVEEFDLSNPADLSYKLLEHINEKKIKSYETDYKVDSAEYEFKKNYENIINEFRKLSEKWKNI